MNTTLLHTDAWGTDGSQHFIASFVATAADIFFGLRVLGSHMTQALFSVLFIL